MTDLTTLTPAQMDDLFVKAWMGHDRAYGSWQHYTEQVEKGHSYYEQHAAKARVKLDAAKAEVRRLQAEFDRRGGWTRYWLVVNHDGHVHRSTSCSTTFPTTRWSLPTELSGMTEDEMVASVGHMACTVCFPSAPVHPEFVRSQAEAEAAEAAKRDAQCAGSGEYAQNANRAYRPYATCHVCGKRGVSVTRGGNLRGHKSPEQDKAELVAKVAADPKLILGVNGEVMRTHRGDEIKTVVSAKRDLVDVLFQVERGEATYKRWVGGERKYLDVSLAEHADALAAALAAKQGVTRDEVLAACEKSLKTRRKRGW